MNKFMVAVILLALSACGQKAALYYPETTPMSAPQVSAPTVKNIEPQVNASRQAVPALKAKTTAEQSPSE